MTLVSPSVIKSYAEACGHPSLDEEGLLVMTRECEYRCRRLLQEAKKYMNHARRTKLIIDDLNYALEAMGEQPLYGYDGLEALQFRPVSTNVAATMLGTTASSILPKDTIWIVPNEEVNLEDVLTEPLPKAPPPMTLTGHWLAIEGVQPQIPENPNIHDRLKMEDSPSTEKLVVQGGQPTAVFGAVPRKVVLEEADTKPLVKHVLSKEHQLYFDTLTADLGSNTDAKIEAALVSLGKDAGLQQLVPYFVQWIAELVPKNLKDPSRLFILIRALSTLLSNEHLLLEPYLHQLMPPVLTCIVGKKLCEDPERDGRHWKLREEAANVLNTVLQKFGSTYHSLVPRVSKTLTKALVMGSSEDEPPYLTSQYGAIVALAKMGPQAVSSLLEPHVPSIVEGARQAGGTCGQAVLSALCDHAHAQV
jgi:transcription initiation factor TFIID subunit 6